MQKMILTFITLCLVVTVFGQKTEYRFSLNSGLFSFSGASAAPTSFINYSSSFNKAYTNNPYGSKNGLCYGLSASRQRVSKKKILTGLDLGYEILRSKISVNGISGYAGGSTASGKTFLVYHFINLHPFIGFRFMIQQLPLDITGGLDISFCLSARENGHATAADGKQFTTSTDRRTISSDVMPRIQFSTSYKKTGLYLGYSYGLANYMTGYIGGKNEAYARLLRFGLTYQIK